MPSLSRNLIANFIGRSWTSVLAMVLIPIYIKFMGIEAYGLVGFYLTLNGVFGILDLGIGATMNRELARRSVGNDYQGSQRDLVRTLELIYWAISIIIGVIVVFFAPFIATTWIKTQNLSVETVLRTVQIMGVALALQFPMSMYQGGLMGLQKQVLVNVILVIHGTLRGAGAVLALYLVSPTIITYFVWQAIASLIGTFAFLIAVWVHLPVSNKLAKFNMSILKEIWKFAAALSANALIGIILSQLDKVILSRMLTLKMFAYYSIATTAASVIWMIILPFSNAIFSDLVQMHELDNKQDIKLFFHKSSQILSLVLLPISAVFVIFSREILILWMHDVALANSCYLIVSFLVFGTMLNGIVSIPCNNAMAFGWPQLITYTNLIQSIILIPLIIVMVNWLQGVGAGISWIILNSVYIIFMVPVFFKRFLEKEKTKWYLQDVFLPMLVAFGVCLISFLCFPKTLLKPLILGGWLISTGIIVTIATGFTLPHIRKIVRMQIKYSFYK